jgi:dTDP-4-dehydrorhamnose reductase
MTDILLIGTKGQLGGELNQILPTLGDVVGVDKSTMDLAKPEMISQVIRQIKPKIIVNAAAYTAVDKAESEAELAEKVNGLAPRIMAEEADNLGANLIHISTDYVFDGKKNTPYLEEDLTNPLSIYGQTKLAGEEAIKNTDTNYIILRTAWVYGSYGKGNFVKTMLRLAQEREQLKVVIDQLGSPTWARDIAQVIASLIPQFNQQKNVRETYHFTNCGVCSWYDFAVAIVGRASKLGYSVKVKEIIPITTAEYPTPAKRPAYSVLSNQKITKLLGYYPPYWRNSLRQMLTEFRQQPYIEE